MILTAKPGKGEKIHLSLDGEYIATVNADYWFTCGIKSGSEVTPEQLEELLTESARRKMMNKALDLLSMRDYSRRELSDKLVTKAWEKKEQKDMDLGSLKQQASDICDRLEELGLLNEERFARSYVDELIRRKHLSKSGLKTALIQKGVQRDIIETVLNRSANCSQPSSRTVTSPTRSRRPARSTRCSVSGIGTTRSMLPWVSGWKTNKQLYPAFAYCESRMFDLK